MRDINQKIRIMLVLLCSAFYISNAVADTLFDKQFSTRVKEAQSGNKRAQYKLGVAYLTGSQVKVDISRSIYWFNKAAQKGYVKAMFKLGVIYYSKRAGKRNQKKAFRWFTKAAKTKHARSAYYLAKVYFEGVIVGRDTQRALHWVKLAKQYGFRDADKLSQAIRDSGKFGRAPDRAVLAHVPRRPIKPIVRKVANKSRNKNRRNNRKKSRAVVNSLAQSKQMIYKSSWKLKGEPAEHLPSDLNKCIPNGVTIRCKSRTIVRNNDVYNAHVEIESILKNFTPTGKFAVDYRVNYLQVSPVDANSADPDNEVPKVGWQKSVSKLRCTLVDKNMLKCFTDDFKVERYYKE